MKITLTGSLGNIGKPLTQKLVEAGHEVTVITSSTKTAAEIETLGAKPAVGSVEDIDFLTHTFKGADVVYTMVPNNFGAASMRKYIASIGQNYADAIVNAGIQNIVNLSSIGADLDGGTGPIAGLHDVEGILNKLNINIKHLRPAYFYTNFFNDVALIKNLGFTGSNFDENTNMVLVHPKDIATTANTAITTAFDGKTVQYIYSTEEKAGNIAKVLGNAIAKPDLSWVEFSDEQALEGMLQAGLPAEIAKNYVEMGTAIRDGKLHVDFAKNKPQASETKLEDFAIEFAAKYNS